MNASSPVLVQKTRGSGTETIKISLNKNPERGGRFWLDAVEHM